MTNEIEHYFQNLKNPKHHADLQRLREFVKALLPEASEDLTYNMPTCSQIESGDVHLSRRSEPWQCWRTYELTGGKA